MKLMFKRTLVFVLATLILITGVACKKSKEYTVSFDSNGGSKVETQTVLENKTVNEPSDPVKPGFTFLEWQYGGKAYDFATPVTQDITLVAEYSIDEDTELVLVTFDYQNDGKSKVVEIAKGYATTEPPVPTKQGYKFVGWYLDDTKFDFSTVITENITLVAKWKADKKVEGTDNSKKGNSSSENLTVNEKNTETINTSLDYTTVVKKYTGKWFLQGYADVYIDVAKSSQYDCLNIEATGISFPVVPNEPNSLKGYTLYPFRYSNKVSAHGIELPFSAWSEWLDMYDVSFGENCIYLGNKKFVKTKGTKDKYDGMFCEEALGKWYLKNNADITMEIYKVGGNEDSGDIYAIKTDFNLVTLEYDKNDFVTVTAALQSDWDKYGISVSNGVLTIKNSYGTRTFYKNKTGSSTSNETTTRPSATTTKPPTTTTTKPSTATTTTPNYSDVRLVTGSETLSNITINTDVYITSSGRATFNNVTVNGNVYCYGQLTVSGGSANNLYAYYWDLGGITSSCNAWDGTHGLVEGGFKSCGSVVIEDTALDYAFNKWGKR